MQQVGTTDKFLDVFQDFRMPSDLMDQYQTEGKKKLGEKIQPFLVNNEPIRFVMLGFPFKSTNDRDKVLGKLPDMGEQLTLETFSKFNEKVKQVYAPGVDITIVSDGYIFNDLLGETDGTVHQYKEISMDMGKNANAPMTWYDLGDFYSGKDLSTKREKVMNQFSLTPEELQTLILTDRDTNYLYVSMIKFMTEELANRPFPSNSQRQKAAKRLVREMMMRNEAYSNLVRKEFHDHVRLSMHKSINNGNKYSFQLIPGKHATHSAWHSAIFEHGDEHITLHRKDAEQMHLELVHKDGRPYYFTGEIKKEESL
jgi:pyoverdine/dityrosine biosynthesis protein Dit1